VSIASINAWHQAARPSPTDADLRVQIGCHLEEVVEMIDALVGADGDSEEARQAASAALDAMAIGLKRGQLDVAIADRRALLDSIADQVVTAVGVAHCAHMKPVEAAAEVDRSNWTKFVDGKPVRDANGKIKKGPYYTPPNLEGMY
jgi:predicted HAD superfamily Cof-like phosphohydrolase